MKTILKHIQGDKAIWAIVAVLAICSFMPVYSASTNLVYVVGTGGSTFGYLLKHMMLLLMGFAIICHNFNNYKTFRKIKLLYNSLMFFFITDIFILGHSFFLIFALEM